jgi:2'-5' RNA ligase
MTENLRLFVAVEVPLEIRGVLHDYVQEIGSGLSTAKWVPASNMHLTLKFLGSCHREQLPAIIEQLKTAAARVKPFIFDLNVLGGFPSKKRARVFWAGTDREIADFVSLAGRCDKFLSALGFERETREFNPHLTLARFKVPQDIRPAIESAGLPAQISQPVEVMEIVLFQSHL